MRGSLCLLVALCSCIRGPELYPDHLSIFEDAPPAVQRVVFTDFYQLSAPKSVKSSVETMPNDPKANKIIDISAEMAERLSLEGVSSEAKEGFSPMELLPGDVLIRGVLAKRNQGSRAGRAFSIASTVAIGGFLFLLFQALPVTNIYTIDCKYNYFVEVVGPKGKVLLHKEGEILAEYTTRLITTKNGKCQAPNQKTMERIKTNLSQDLAEFLLTNQQPSSQPTTAPAP
jgi:hypothetical protein